MQKEEWRPVEGFEGKYEVSNLGEVRSISRVVYFQRKDGSEGSKVVHQRILRPKVDKDGYLEYCLSSEGKNHHRRGHRLVALAFLPRVNGCDVIDHVDNVKDNNNVNNLRWVTATQNTILYYKNFTKGKGLTSLTKEDWLGILALHLKGYTYKQIVDEFSLDISRPDNLGDGLSGRRFSSVTGFTEDMRLVNKGKLTDTQCFEILNARLVSKEPLKVIAQRYDIAISLVSKLCSGSRRPDILEKFKQSQR